MVRRRLAAVLAAVLTTALVLAPGAADAKPKPKPKDPSGHYVGHEVPVEANGLDTMIYELDLTKKGRRITDFTVRFNAVCSYPLDIMYVVQPVGPVKVDRSGRFHYLYEKDAADDFDDVRLEVTGRLRGTTIRKGTFSYEVGYCSRGDADDPMRWTAERTRKR